MPRLIGRQNAAWLLISSEWINAEEALRENAHFAELMGAAANAAAPTDFADRRGTGS